MQDGVAKGDDFDKEGGVLSVISFHSLEDRIVKEHFRYWAGITTPKDFFGRPTISSLGTLIHKKGLSGKEYDAQIRVHAQQDFGVFKEMSNLFHQSMFLP